jgi:hypothetical protein
MSTPSKKKLQIVSDLLLLFFGSVAIVELKPQCTKERKKKPNVVI